MVRRPEKVGRRLPTGWLSTNRKLIGELGYRRIQRCLMLAQRQRYARIIHNEVR